ncbi:MAG TPA: PHB depolymerase family esterase [Polyangia bacterium]|nr:PHB depolymerase family esterase [Polyangia bacterium]
MFRLHVVAALTVTLAFGACSSSPKKDMTYTPSNAAVMARPYDYDQPAGYDAAKPYPLIVLLHGYGANGFVQDALFGWAQLADDRGVFVAHPDGTVDAGGSHFWNATDACCDEQHTGVDDVAYLNAVVDDMEANFNIDKKRVFFAGHSNGGFMSHRMACDAAGRVAAIMALAGDNWQDPSKCNPTEPVAVLQVHGDADTLVPYDGAGLMPSAKQSVGSWAVKNGCTGDLTDTGETLDIDYDIAGAETTVANYACTVGAAELWTIHGGQHVPSLILPDWGNHVFDWLMQHPKP